VGEPLGSAQQVTVQHLIDNAERLAGTTVRIEGNVSAMCQHRRGWFAVQDRGDRSGQYVRVMAAPRFLVPQGAVGRRATTEGVVEFVTVPAAAARHFAEDYALGDADEVRGDTRAVVLRATGAEFL
jgi:hypothetical protein